MIAIFIVIACSISIVEPTEGSKEAQLRETLLKLEHLSSDLETAAFQLESYLDETRRHPEDKDAHITEIKKRFEDLQQQHLLLQKEIISWEQNLKVDKE